MPVMNGRQPCLLVSDMSFNTTQGRSVAKYPQGDDGKRKHFGIRFQVAAENLVGTCQDQVRVNAATQNASAAKWQ